MSAVVGDARLIVKYSAQRMQMSHKHPANGLLVGYLLIFSLPVPSALRLSNDS